jgi:hypothetical protein
MGIDRFTVAEETHRARGPLSNAERQRRWRQRKKEQRASIPDRESLRVTDAGPDRPSVTRNEKPGMGEQAIDDGLTKKRLRLNELMAEYAQDLINPGLTVAEVETISAALLAARRTFAGLAKTTHRRLPVNVIAARRQRLITFKTRG